MKNGHAESEFGFFLKFKFSFTVDVGDCLHQRPHSTLCEMPVSTQPPRVLQVPRLEKLTELAMAVECPGRTDRWQMTAQQKFVNVHVWLMVTMHMLLPQVQSIIKMSGGNIRFEQTNRTFASQLTDVLFAASLLVPTLLLDTKLTFFKMLHCIIMICSKHLFFCKLLFL